MYLKKLLVNTESFSGSRRKNSTLKLHPLYLNIRVQARDSTFGTVQQDHLIKTPFLL